MAENKNGPKKTWNQHTKAIALAYNPAEPAPKVVATGQGYVAGKILAKAEEAKVPVVKDELLTEELNQLNLGENIPPELYQAIAQVLLFVMELDKSRDARGY